VYFVGCTGKVVGVFIAFSCAASRRIVGLQRAGLTNRTRSAFQTVVTRLIERDARDTGPPFKSLVCCAGEVAWLPERVLERTQPFRSLRVNAG
jgi:hypothetical protein